MHENGDKCMRKNYSANSEIAMVTGTLILVGRDTPLGLVGIRMGRRHFLKVRSSCWPIVEILRGLENTNSSIISDLLSKAMAVSTISILVGKHAWVACTCLVWRSTHKDTISRGAVLTTSGCQTHRHRK